MPKCSGRIAEEELRVCNEEMRNVGFIRGEDGEIERESFTCDEVGCSLYHQTKMVRLLPTSAKKEGN